ncbi:MAG: ATP-binding protein [Anaerovoracaceae bacterium]
MKNKIITAITLTVSLAIILCSWIYISTQKMPVIAVPQIENGVLDLSKTDMEHGVVELPSNWAYFPNELYGPEDFARGSDEDQNVNTIENVDMSNVKYGTYRLKLKLVPNQSYSMCGYSLDYSSRYYVNGMKALDAGMVGKSAEDTVPRINYYTIPVTANEQGDAEIIVQVANFVHKEGGFLNTITFSTPTSMEIYKRWDTLATSLSCGALLVLFAYYLIKFCIRRKMETFYFSMCCLVFALRDQTFYVNQLIPWDYDWFIHYRIVVMFVAIQPLVLYMLLKSLYPDSTSKIVNCIYGGVNILIVIAMFVRPTMETSQISNMAYYAAVPAFIYLILSIFGTFWHRKKLDKKDIITFAGFGILFLTMVYEIKWQRIIPEITRAGVTPLGMLAFILLIMVVVEIRYEEYAVKLLEATQINKTLEKQNTMRREFLSNISHEMLTPLTVISGYAQRAITKIKNRSVTEETCEGLLHITLEAQRLAILVENMLDNPLEETSGTVKIGKISPVDFGKRVKILCDPILEKNDNVLQVEIEENCPDGRGNFEMLIQVVLNLCINANRHTKEDGLILTIEEKDGKLVFAVEDHGDGMDEEVREKVFERGYSGDGKTGLGLAICKDVISFMQGDIQIYSQKTIGTKVVFSINVWKEDE